jgi:phosphatidylinositol glycan class A protein
MYVVIPIDDSSEYADGLAGVPIIPVVCQNYYHLFNGKTRFRSGSIKLKGMFPDKFPFEIEND